MSHPVPNAPSDRDDALAVLSRLRDAGHVAYFAGGCVRDLLMGQSPKDYDVATDAPPGRVRELFSNTQAVGAAFGVILVRQRKSMIEVATFRTDGSYTDGRRPDSVQFTTAEHDAQRRDFTINGLFLDPIEDRIIDYVGGQADLAAKVIRAIGDPAQRFAEDYLRILRAVRFAARFEFTIEPATANAIRAQAKNITQVSPERIADELRRMLTAPSRAKAWQLLQALELLPLLFRGVTGSHARQPLPMGDTGGQAVSFPLALALGLSTFLTAHSGATQLKGKWVADTVRKVRTLLKLSNDERDALFAILDDAGGLLHDTWTDAKMMRFLAKPTATDCRAFLRELQSASMDDGRVSAVEAKLSELETRECNPPPLITGDVLVAHGLRPGPKFKMILDTVYDAQLESRVQNYDAALTMALQLAETNPGR